MNQTIMDVKQVFHMNGGHGETSYAENSSHQKRVAERVMPIVLKAVEETYVSLRPECLVIASLGCSSGPNELSRIKQVVEAVEKAGRAIHQPIPELMVCLNDLPTNDFNTILKGVPDLKSELKKRRGDADDDGIGARGPSVYVAAYPGTFYGRLFPDVSLHFIFSISSLHWLSQVPRGIYDEHGVSLNKKSIYLSKNSPSKVCEAYLKQFQEDFSVFLKTRSKEMVCGGKMVIMLLGRNGPNIGDGGSTSFWEVLYESFCSLITKRIVAEEKVNSYDVHYFEPSVEEVKDVVRDEGSFELDNFEVHENENVSVSDTSRGKAVAKEVRAIQESMITHHFGPEILNPLFEEYARLYDQVSSQKVFKSINLAFTLKKLYDM